MATRGQLKALKKNGAPVTVIRAAMTGRSVEYIDPQTNTTYRTGGGGSKQVVIKGYTKGRFIAPKKGK